MRSFKQFLEARDDVGSYRAHIRKTGSRSEKAAAEDGAGAARSRIIPVTANPHPHGSRENAAWHGGFFDQYRYSTGSRHRWSKDKVDEMAWANLSHPEIPAQYKGQKATHADKDGYRVTVSAKNGPHDDVGEVGHDYEKVRSGRFHITHPNGESIEGGHWMDFPETHDRHPKAPGVDLHKDYFDHAKRGTEHESAWHTKLSVQDRVDLEAHNQGTRYDSLKDQFKYRKDIQARKRS